MGNIKPILIILGIFFILLGILNYLKIFKKFEYFYKITKVSRKINVCIITFMFFFIFLYALSLNSILSGHMINNKFALVISSLLFIGGCFVYIVVIFLKKTFFSVESYHMEMIKSLVRIVELRDKYTKGHSEDVASLVEMIFDHLPVNLKGSISKNDLIQAALLHDIGKVLVTDNVLNKKGALTDLEYELIKKHVDDGSRILGAFEVFQNIIPWIKYHHERIDGNGYHGLKGNNIPLESKIIAVADTYSALTTNRTYRNKISPSKAIEILKNVSGRQLDSRIVDILATVVGKKLNQPLNLASQNKKYKTLIENNSDFNETIPKQYKKIKGYMSLKNKFLSVFFIFILILTLAGFDFYQVSSETQRANKNFIEQKQAVIDLYQRRDFIKSLLLIDNYDNFIHKERKLKIKKIDMELKKSKVFKGVDDLEVIENKILSLHRENLKLNLEFSNIYKKEKSIRHIIRDLVYKSKDYSETKALGKVIYESKEAIFQYRDQKHFDEWSQSIYTLKKLAKTTTLVAYLEEYHQIYSTISEIILSQDRVLTDIKINMKDYNSILMTVDSNVNLLETDINKSIENTNKSMQHELILTLLMILIFFIAFGTFIHSQLIKPLGILKQSTRELSKKNFDYKINLNKNDEIGELAHYFNIMVNNLKSAYSNLEEKVKERTKKLQDSNSNLLKEVQKRKKLEKTLKTQAITDELTGLFNRRAAYRFLSDEIQKSKTQGYSLTICYLDIDDFKKINDNLGHKEGDRCLKEFSEILRLNLRQDDYIFRVGGDEFMAAFPKKSKKDVDIFFKNRILPELRLKLDIEFSYGLLVFSKDNNMSLDEIMKKTDENMYKDKIQKKKKASRQQNPSFV